MQIYSDKIFEKPIEVIETFSNFREAFKKIEKLGKKYYLIGFINYDFDYLYFEVFDKFKTYIPNPPKKLGTILKSKISKQNYCENIEKIKEYISNGVTYEVNYTYPIDVKTNLDGIDLYEAILPKQKTLYNAFIQTPKLNLLSFSPELFFRLQGRRIFTKPMKGTTPRGKDAKEDDLQKNFLYNDIKNRAENIMIVDLLRNDLGRISKVGSVEVTKLFDIEKYPTLFQMTSEIQSEIEDNITLYDVFKSIFPCGSITGAPKISTMRVIRELESFKRNIYCGAIGFVSPEVCEFSVPIRILYGKNYSYNYHTGGAVVWDSNAEDEWGETVTKAKIINTDFNLIESALDDWQSHVLRMKNSAKELGFVWNEEIEKLKIPTGKVLRVELKKNGTYEVTTKLLKKIKSNKIQIRGCVNSNNPFLYHKTSIRTSSPECIFDEIRVNEKGEITEGTFTNIAVEIDGKLFTPPLTSGLLNGTFRQKLILRGEIEERILYPEDLKNADRIFCFNSLRKMVEVFLC